MSFAIVPVLVHRIIFLDLVLLMVFAKSGKNIWEKACNWFSTPFLIAQVIYALVHSERIVTRIAFIDDLTTLDMLFGVVLILVILEATRRCAGLALTMIVVLFNVYAFAGDFLPGFFSHGGFSVTNFIDTQVYSPGGIFGIPIGAVIAYVFYFILFTSFLEISGGGQLFTDAAVRIAGWARGGPAKAAVIASACEGTISGSAIANVVGSGAFTIPLMKRTGVAPHFAGAVEAAASTGGQLMPPVMGAAAFIMAEITGISYPEIALSAAIPAMLYFLGIFFQVDFFAQREGLVGLKRSDLPDLGASVKKYGHLMISLVALVYFMAIGNSLMASGMKATILLVVISFLRKDTRMLPMKCLEAIRSSMQSMPSIAVPCAAAGIIIATVIGTNLGLQFSATLLSMASGSMFLSLIVTMLVCIILGMGMPTVSAYIIVVLLMVPTIIQMGVPVLATHMFVFYFALLSFVTPPVALASYTAAGIARADAGKTGWVAFQLCLSGFIIPFIIINDQALLLQGPAYWVVWRTLITVLGLYVLSGAVMGWYFTKASPVERVLGIVAAALLVTPLVVTDYIGIALCVFVLVIQYRKAQKVKKEAAEPVLVKS